MKITGLVFSLFIFFAAPLQAEGPPLLVAVDQSAPPFDMRGAHSQLYGFDISMMEYICREIKRTCQYQAMPFGQLLPTVQSGKAEVAIGSIIITPERAQMVNFSNPYLNSESRFISNAHAAQNNFTLSMLNNRKIGVEQDTVFPDIINSLALTNPKVITYSKLETLIEDLYHGEIDFALMDNPTALYWQSQSSGIIKPVGKPFSFGFGLGIAVRPGNTQLLQQINNALARFEKSPDFKRAYEQYLAYF
ncbi:transporter substrate-binding domain-containing protein [Legionella spiritensis]|uniref:transporter substrate-binding domain-containing protein n=1 Tax=Legionella spiritensis TaxID=452 RepID=UPI000F6D1CB7|nr:transporter substrate-binding domain-containing protein [Legionella spiritensis]VEG92435.1 putative amino acid ABC transporter, periplasmic binding protein [Legionella spiritensis]